MAARFRIAPPNDRPANLVVADFPVEHKRDITCSIQNILRAGLIETK